MTVPTMTSFFIPRLWVVMAKDVEVASLFQPYWCRIADILGSHLGQVAGAVIEATELFQHLLQFQAGETPDEKLGSNRTRVHLVVPVHTTMAICLSVRFCWSLFVDSG